MASNSQANDNVSTTSPTVQSSGEPHGNSTSSPQGIVSRPASDAGSVGNLDTNDRTERPYTAMVACNGTFELPMEAVHPQQRRSSSIDVTIGGDCDHTRGA